MDALFRNRSEIIQLRNHRENHKIKTKSVQEVNEITFICCVLRTREVNGFN